MEFLIQHSSCAMWCSDTMENGYWGLCAKCNNNLDKHYDVWCPSCEPPNPTTRKVFDYFKIARQEGYSDETEFVHKALENLDFPGNDSLISVRPGLIGILSTDDEYLMKYYTGMLNHFDIRDNEEIILEISW
jgi:hypothetical protein